MNFDDQVTELATAMVTDTRDAERRRALWPEAVKRIEGVLEETAQLLRRAKMPAKASTVPGVQNYGALTPVPRIEFETEATATIDEGRSVRTLLWNGALLQYQLMAPGHVLALFWPYHQREEKRSFDILAVFKDPDALTADAVRENVLRFLELARESRAHRASPPKPTI